MLKPGNSIVSWESSSIRNHFQLIGYSQDNRTITSEVFDELVLHPCESETVRDGGNCSPSNNMKCQISKIHGEPLQRELSSEYHMTNSTSSDLFFPGSPLPPFLHTSFFLPYIFPPLYPVPHGIWDTRKHSSIKIS